MRPQSEVITAIAKQASEKMYKMDTETPLVMLVYWYNASNHNPLT